jgi:hypothetical protein
VDINPYVGSNPNGVFNPPDPHTVLTRPIASPPLGPTFRFERGEDWLGHMGTCIPAHDPLGRLGQKLILTVIGAPVPKSLIGQSLLLGTKNPYTGFVRIVLPDLPTAGKLAVGDVVSAAWIAYGVGMAGVEIYCAATF